MKNADPAISLCMIVKNEELYLGSCLDSVQGLADEIIIVDTGSTDHTLEIASRYTDRIYPYQWQDDFSQARNYSLEFATGDWILVLDADETISARDHERIREFVRNPSVDACKLIQRSYCSEETLAGWKANPGDYAETRDYPGYTESPLVRLFRNEKGIRFRGRIHELVEYALSEQHRRVLKTDIPIHHFAEFRSRAEIELKNLKYRKLGEEKVRDNAGDARAYLELGKQCMILHEFEEAEKAFRKALTARPAAGSPRLNLGLIHGEACHNLGIIYEGREEYGRAEESYRKAIEFHPGFAAAYNNLGNVLKRLGRYPEAAEFYLRGIKAAPDNFAILFNYGALLEASGSLPEALQAYLRALELAPGHLESLIAAGEILFSRSEWDRSERLFSRALEIDPANVRALTGLGAVFASSKRMENAVELFLRAVELEPEHGPARSNLALAYLYTGRKGLALEQCRVLKQLGLKPPFEFTQERDAGLTGTR